MDPARLLRLVWLPACCLFAGAATGEYFDSGGTVSAGAGRGAGGGYEVRDSLGRLGGDNLHGGPYTVRSGFAAASLPGESSRPTLVISVARALRPYGQPNPPLTGTITGLIGEDDITASFSSPATPDSPVGVYTVRVEVRDPGDRLRHYNVLFNPGTLTLTRVPLHASADDQVRPYAQENPIFTGVFSGVVNDDPISVRRATAASPDSFAGRYAIEVELLDPAGRLGNYDLMLQGGTLTITGGPPTLDLGANVPVYTLRDGPTPVIPSLAAGLKWRWKRRKTSRPKTTSFPCRPAIPGRNWSSQAITF
jgi:hypothetical protein